LSRERVRAELFKLLAGPGAAGVVAAMEQAGLLMLCTGGIAYPARFARLVALQDAGEAAPDGVLRLAALFVTVAEDAERLRDRLRLSNAEGDRLSRGAIALAGLHGVADPPPAGELRHFLFLHGRRAALDAVALAHVDSAMPLHDQGWASAASFIASTPEPTLPFSGADLLSRGVPPGRTVGALLKTLQGLWIRAGFPQEPARLAQLLDEAMADLPPPD
jgi:poly(A) polymerase